MEFLQLKYFVLVAKLGNMTQAANELYVAQPSVSQAIARLERELGTKLFTRIGRRITLNASGEILLKYAQQALQSLEQAEREIRSCKQATADDVTVSIWRGSAVMSRMLSDMQRQMPAMKIKTTHSANPASFDLRISMGLLNQPPAEPYEVLLKERILLAVPLSNPLSAQESIKLKMIENQDFIGLEDGKPFRQLTESLCRRAGFLPRVTTISDSAESLRQFLALNLGVAFIPEYTWGNWLDAPNAAYRVIDLDEEDFARQLYLSWPQNKPLVNASLALADIARRHFQRLKVGREA